MAQRFSPSPSRRFLSQDELHPSRPRRAWGPIELFPEGQWQVIRVTLEREGGLLALEGSPGGFRWRAQRLPLQGLALAFGRRLEHLQGLLGGRERWHCSRWPSRAMCASASHDSSTFRAALCGPEWSTPIGPPRCGAWWNPLGPAAST